MKELWKAVAGFEGLYEVSNHGRVRSLTRWVNSKAGSLRRERGRLMKLGLSGHPNPAHAYLRASLKKEGTNYGRLVHRLVAVAFIPNPKNKPQVNHRKNPKTNNRVTNLEWATKAEDDAHAKANGLDAKGSQHGMAKLNEAKVSQMRALRAAGTPRHVLADMFGVTQSHTNGILRGVTWKHIPLYPQPTTNSKETIQ